MQPKNAYNSSVSSFTKNNLYIPFAIKKITITILCFRWEQSGKISVLNSRIITRAVELNLKNITTIFANEVNHMHIISDILDTMEIPVINDSFNPPIQVILNLTQSTVNYFFVCCKNEGMIIKQTFQRFESMLVFLF